MGQFYDENKIKEMETAAGAQAEPPKTAATSASPAGGTFYDEARIKAMEGSASPAQARTQKLATYGLIALLILAGLGFLWWKMKHNPDTMIVDLNKASVTELEYIDGVGPARARDIIAKRPYTTIEELKKVPGIGPKTFERIKPRVKVE